MSSFKQLQQTGALKRQDAHAARVDDIVVDPNFNTREHGDRLASHINEIFKFIMAGGTLPPLEVIPTQDGKVQIVDGHCRYDAYVKAIAAGAPIEYIPVRQFVGNDAKRIARITTSNEGLKLTPLETARVYAKLRALNLNPEEIGREVGKTRQHVDQLLHLADAPTAVQQMVAAGKVSATEALKVARQHGDGATEVLQKAANDNGGKKVTGKALKPFTPPAAVAMETVAALDTFTAALAVGDVIEIQKAHEPNATYTIKVPISALQALLDVQGSIEVARDKFKTKQRQRQEQTAQGDIEQAAA